ncbi:hypothetical protein M2139_002842 [Enterococcus sp. PF1-24]|uniref:hypothetical protein n=1 Tax=unclassified Enterococcus TaxID=2608891 RepID=UPI00247583BA|nr:MULTISPECIES: hypothetical protein [unclassified Enterococcus]MDH6365808.1 hypothetical protein [Enterococcus sp. PFB1-1]MDH6402912.1 hypothetical protein [Enterococcus sp. PF1-24]
MKDDIAEALNGLGLSFMPYTKEMLKKMTDEELLSLLVGTEFSEEEKIDYYRI